MNYLYDEIGFKGLGQQNIALCYAGFFVFNFIAPKMISMFSDVKIAIFVGFLFYDLMMVAGVFTYYCHGRPALEGICDAGIVKGVNYVANFMQGSLGGTLVWTGQCMYLNQISLKSEKSKVFSYFFAVYVYSDLFGNLFNIIYYSFDVGTLLYFLIFATIILLADLFLLIVIPGISGYDPTAYQSSLKTEEQETLTVKSLENPAEPDKTITDSLKIFWSLVKDPKMLRVMPYAAQSGLLLGYLSGGFYKVPVHLYPDSDTNFVKRMISLVVISYSLISSIFSRAMSTPLFKANSIFIMKACSVIFTLVAAYLTFYLDSVTSIWVVFACTLPMAICNSSKQVQINVYMAENFNGEVESFLIYKQLNNLFVCIFMAAIVYLTETQYYIWLTCSNTICCVLTLVFLRDNRKAD